VRPGAEPKLSTGVLRRDACGARCCGWSHEVRPSVMAEVRCMWGPGAGSQGRRGLSCVATCWLVDLFALISDRLRVDSR
jgi:hypothetical protein